MDYKDKLIGMIGIENNEILNRLTKGEKNMEEILKKVEDFSEDEEILGEYDAEERKLEDEYFTRLGQLEEATKEGLEKGIEQGKNQKQIQIVKSMIKENIDLDIISRVTGLSTNEIKTLE